MAITIMYDTAPPPLQLHGPMPLTKSIIAIYVCTPFTVCTFHLHHHNHNHTVFSSPPPPPFPPLELDS